MKTVIKQIKTMPAAIANDELTAVQFTIIALVIFIGVAAGLYSVISGSIQLMEVVELCTL
ncbi:hypothetical protein [Mucilaginibacter sp.]|uniref:hypothetical protein n=1 Tax=Mucilaginibacter sp. TaxID=1882438 RepID=UPI0026221FE2|nr:hypothetical protein [Mucilaginibacter sp.]MDB4918776.1 hypothetical protein [Mucilaginibacter sp.]